jgi:hypothetical protein
VAVKATVKDVAGVTVKATVKDVAGPVSFMNELEGHRTGPVTAGSKMMTGTPEEGGDRNGDTSHREHKVSVGSRDTRRRAFILQSAA